MNYHIEFLKIYNEGFEKIREDLIQYLKENLNADETFTVIFRSYRRRLMDLQKEHYSKDDILINCYNNFFLRYEKYEKNAVKNIINKDIYQYYKTEKEENNEGINDFANFIDSLAILAAYRDMEEKINKNTEEIKIAFTKNKITKILNLEKHQDGEYLIDHREPAKIENTQSSKPKLIVDKKSDQISAITINDDEKLLLLHFIFTCNKNPNYLLKEVEFLTALRITKDVHHNKKLTDFYGTDYKKLKKGLKYYSENNSNIKKMLDQIFKVCDTHKLKVIRDYIRTIYPK